MVLVALLSFALLDGDQSVLELGHVPNVSEDESEDLASRVLRQHRHVADGVAVALLAVGGIEHLVAVTGVDKMRERVGARGGAT